MSEILAFSETSAADTTSSATSETQPTPEPDTSSSTEKVASSENRTDSQSDLVSDSKTEFDSTASDSNATGFTSEDTNNSENASSSHQDPFIEKEKTTHQRRFFHTSKELNYLREKYILEKIPDDQLLEYLKLEEKRHELQVQERNIREKRIMHTFMLTAVLAAIVAIIYCLHGNPTVLISILYIGGILAAIQFWNKKR